LTHEDHNKISPPRRPYCGLLCMRLRDPRLCRLFLCHSYDGATSRQRYSGHFWLVSSRVSLRKQYVAWIYWSPGMAMSLYSCLGYNKCGHDIAIRIDLPTTALHTCLKCSRVQLPFRTLLSFEALPCFETFKTRVLCTRERTGHSYVSLQFLQDAPQSCAQLSASREALAAYSKRQCALAPFSAVNASLPCHERTVQPPYVNCHVQQHGWSLLYLPSVSFLSVY